MSVTITAEQLLGYKRYCAFLSQNQATLEVIANVVSDDTPFPIAFSRTGTGSYVITRPDNPSFDPTKTAVINGYYSIGTATGLERTVPEFEFVGDDLYMRFRDKGGDLWDFDFVNFFIEIRIYP